jgi:phage head maturation protease
MTLFPIRGYAARTGVEFFNADKNRIEWFVPGCFAGLTAQPIVLGVNHSACLCQGGDPRIDDRRVFARTDDDTLALTEDAYGLRLAALLRHDAAIQYGDDAPINLLAAIADGRCTGLSLHLHGGDRWIGPNVPADVLAWAKTRIVEVSLVIGKPPGSPDTWIAIDTAAARQRLAACLRQAEAA